MALKSHRLGSDEARRNWRDVLDAVMKGESVMIVRSGKPLGVIIPFELWERAKDTLENIDDDIDLRITVDYYRREVAAGRLEADPVMDRAIAHMESDRD